MDEPGPPEFRNVDFSQAHFLDHTIWTCGSDPEAHTGGRRRHLENRWDFIWKPTLKSWTLCKIGCHARARAWRGHIGKSESFTVCVNCAKRF